MAEYDGTAAQREVILKETRKGLKQARKKGKHIGSPSGANQESFVQVKNEKEKSIC